MGDSFSKYKHMLLHADPHLELSFPKHISDFGDTIIMGEFPSGTDFLNMLQVKAETVKN